jgi:hypothetical protein
LSKLPSFFKTLWERGFDKTLIKQGCEKAATNLHAEISRSRADLIADLYSIVDGVLNGRSPKAYGLEYENLGNTCFLSVCLVTLSALVERQPVLSDVMKKSVFGKQVLNVIHSDSEAAKRQILQDLSLADGKQHDAVETYVRIMQRIEAQCPAQAKKQLHNIAFCKITSTDRCAKCKNSRGENVAYEPLWINKPASNAKVVDVKIDCSRTDNQKTTMTACSCGCKNVKAEHKATFGKFAVFAFDRSTSRSQKAEFRVQLSSNAGTICNAVFHKGAKPDSGHYTSIVNKRDLWFKTSDAHVEPMKWNPANQAMRDIVLVSVFNPPAPEIDEAAISRLRIRGMLNESRATAVPRTSCSSIESVNDYV